MLFVVSALFTEGDRRGWKQFDVRTAAATQ